MVEIALLLQNSASASLLRQQVRTHQQAAAGLSTHDSLWASRL